MPERHEFGPVALEDQPHGYTESIAPPLPRKVGLMSENERLKQEFSDAAKSIKGAVKEATGHVLGDDDLVQEGARDKKEPGTPSNGDVPGPSHPSEGGGRVAGEQSGREW
jgi:hypothetical protein